MQDVETLKMQSLFFGCRKEAKSVRVCVLIACTFPMMAKVDFGKEADVGENKAISHAAIKKIKESTGMPIIFMKDMSLTTNEA